MNSLSLVRKAISNTLNKTIFRSLVPYYILFAFVSLISTRSTWSYMQRVQVDPLNASPTLDYFLFSFLAGIAGLLFSVLVISVLRSFEEKNPLSIPKLNQVIAKAWKIFLVSLVSYLFILLGTICFIVPGIFLTKRYIFVLNVAEEKMLGPIQSMRRSRELSKGNGWAVIIALVLLLIPFYIIFIPLMYKTYPVYNPSASYFLFWLSNTILGYIGSIAPLSILSSAYEKAKTSAGAE